MKLHERIRCIVRLQATATIKAVLMALAHHADGQGKCWPSQQLLADDAGTTPRTIRRVLRQLHKLGIVTSARRYNQSTIYIVQFDADTVSGQSGRSVRMNSTRTSQVNKVPKGYHSKGRPAPIYSMPCGKRHAPSIGCIECHRIREAQAK